MSRSIRYSCMVAMDFPTQQPTDRRATATGTTDTFDMREHLDAAAPDAGDVGSGVRAAAWAGRQFCRLRPGARRDHRARLQHGAARPDAAVGRSEPAGEGVEVAGPEDAADAVVLEHRGRRAGRRVDHRVHGEAARAAVPELHAERVVVLQCAARARASRARRCCACRATTRRARRCGSRCCANGRRRFGFDRLGLCGPCQRGAVLLPGLPRADDGGDRCRLGGAGVVGRHRSSSWRRS